MSPPPARARNAAYPVYFLNYFEASPAIVATLGTGLVALISVIIGQLGRQGCEFFKVQCV